MSNEMKLMMALCDALGFEVEKVVDTKETPISEQSGKNRIAASIMSFGTEVDLAVVPSTGEWKRGTNGCYYLRPSMEVDYKVIKTWGNEARIAENLSKYLRTLDMNDASPVEISDIIDIVRTAGVSK